MPVHGRLVALTLVVGTCFLFLYSISSKPPPTISVDEPQIPTKHAPQKADIDLTSNWTYVPETKKSPWCTPDECAAGRWLPRDPPFLSLADFQATFANRLDQVWKGCRAIPNPDGSPPASQAKVDEDRLMQVMNWTWTPYQGQLKPWDAEEFVIRLLKSPGGLVLIGDSITQQHFHALGYQVDQGDIPVDIDPTYLPMVGHKNVRQRVLKAGHPKTLELMRRAGVPESRIKRPILTMLEDHMLIGEVDIRRITERLGASPTYVWYHDFQRVEGWEEFLKNAARPREGEEDSVTEDTIFLMNGGAHWSRHELAMLPARKSNKEEQARVKETYRQMMRTIISRISSTPRLSIYYRSTAPGHPICESHSKPYEGTHAAREGEKHIVTRLRSQQPTDDLKKQRNRWDWDLFEVHNGMWRTTIGRLMRDREGRVKAAKAKGEGEGVQEKEGGAKWFYLDLWDVNLQRPDAHSEPGQDCLHWCLPSVLNQWTAHLYHNLFLEQLEKEGKGH